MACGRKRGWSKQCFLPCCPGLSTGIVMSPLPFMIEIEMVALLLGEACLWAAVKMVLLRASVPCVSFFFSTYLPLSLHSCRRDTSITYRLFRESFCKGWCWHEALIQLVYASSMFFFHLFSSPSVRRGSWLVSSGFTACLHLFQVISPGHFSHLWVCWKGFTG